MFKPNLAKMKEQLDGIQNPKSGGSSSDNMYWRLEPGTHSVRLLVLSSGDIMKDFHWHYGINGKSYLCAKKSFHKDCPICDLASSIWNEYAAGRDANPPKPDESLKEMAKELFASKRFYFPVLVRGLEDEGPKVYSCGSRAAEQIMALAVDPDNADMFDTEKGFDLKITYSLSNPNDRRSASTAITASRKSSPVLKGATPEQLQELFDAIPDFDGLFELPDPDDITKDLDSYISSLDETTNSSLGTAVYATTEEESSQVLDAFKRLAAD